ncbi:PrgI family mobile element protein [Fodinicola acaciae]|uniref:PrgI family mobile element protein n=1 Tax=Fodinicola acaciae TaxID=2681555 RepID=UPI0013D8090E|nr:hypothetical protein [Fodinicola acaciae]
MIVRTFTHAWNMRVRIYAFDDIRLPVKNGISIPQVIAGVAAAVVWVPLCFLLGVPSWVGNAGVATMIIAAPPVIVLLYADRPIAHEKTTEEWLSSWLTHQSEPRRLAALTTAPAPRRVLLTASRWVPQEQLDGDRR